MVKLRFALNGGSGEGYVPQLSYEAILQICDPDGSLASHQIEPVSYDLLLGLLFRYP